MSLQRTFFESRKRFWWFSVFLFLLSKKKRSWKKLPLFNSKLGSKWKVSVKSGFERGRKETLPLLFFLVFFCRKIRNEVAFGTFWFRILCKLRSEKFKVLKEVLGQALWGVTGGQNSKHLNCRARIRPENYHNWKSLQNKNTPQNRLRSSGTFFLPQKTVWLGFTMVGKNLIKTQNVHISLTKAFRA